jgi:branched-chain amino acid transport system permease protein
MARFIALLASGLSVGAIYAVIAISVLILYNATKAVNFAQGDLMTASAYLGNWATQDLGWPTYLGYLLAICAVSAAGTVIFAIVDWKSERRNSLITAIAALGIALCIRTGLSLWRGATPRSLTSPVGTGVVRIFGATVTYQQILVVSVAVILFVAAKVLFSFTSFGLHLRALADDRYAARLQGLRVRRISMAAWAGSCGVAGLAGLLLAPTGSVNLTFGFSSMLGGFAAAVIGGFGSFSGAIIGGISLGLIEQLLGGYVLTSIQDALPYICLLIVLLLKPSGLVPSRTGIRV